MKFVDHKLRVGKLYFHIAVVDLFIRPPPTIEGATYPLFAIDLLHAPRANAIVFTIPVMAITVGYIL